MKIGIVTFHNVYNYGGMLQAYALCQFLNRDGNNCVCIDYRQPALTAKYSHRFWDVRKSIIQNVKHLVAYYLLKRDFHKEKVFNGFLKSHIPLSSEVNSLGEFANISKDFDILVSGSDQLWNPIFTGGALDPVYFLETSEKARKFAYASSAGAYQYKDAELNQIKSYLLNYERIAVREEFLKDQLDSVHNDVSVVIDPTLLLNRDRWSEIRQPIDGLPAKYVLLYTFDNNLDSIKIAKKVSLSLGIPVVSLFRVKSDVKVDYTLDSLSPQQFIELVNNADFVVTNSFHGTAFAVNFSKDFFSIYKKSNPHRVINLLKRLGLTDRVVKGVDELPNSEKWSIDYGLAQKALEEQREFASVFLKF
ncbi:polysaccharide pyruvyl transferase family protein [Sphingobacterium bambusae]|uniref:Polysaccharide pyruvyl transferase family protein n=1 Tax=Sphingobacterium bambusae TaxID=662858 RepID=A0ABW6BAY9_9SPHI|nr:polysaccharide pyruvyl transferase family protein [Sphingobacterium bambusae]WPL46880.1 polysaccharide pyruvyl transferase family protein [Sphingobacterium bambusae]